MEKSLLYPLKKKTQGQNTVVSNVSEKLLPVHIIQQSPEPCQGRGDPSARDAPLVLP